ncbi:MAG: glycosyltransferase family 2 protein, partial [Chitinophagaceae bacterium]|nr:glycosyltransferase family 2 protein [Chitinophagaceae bacterium]
MIELIQYIRPSWYFNLKPKQGNIPYWLDIDKVPDEWKTLVIPTTAYTSSLAQKWDAAYQLWSKGIIAHNTNWALYDTSKVPLADQYRFIKRFYNPVWTYVVALLRILELKNPFLEIHGVWAARNIKKVKASNDAIVHPLDAFESPLLKEKPLVSIIIPTLNRYKYLDDVLVDMDKQTYPNIEVLVVDQSEPYRPEIYAGRQQPIQAWHQEEKALWLARNTAIQRAKGKYILLYDDDSLVEPDWVEQHLKCLDYFQCAISSGVSIA